MADWGSSHAILELSKPVLNSPLDYKLVAAPQNTAPTPVQFRQKAK